MIALALILKKSAEKDRLTIRVKPKMNEISSNVHCSSGTARVISAVDFPVRKHKSNPTYDEKVEKNPLHKDIRFILQAVGPTEGHANLLLSTFLSVLNNAEKIGVRHIVFSCISTGIFNFPKDKASENAVKTIRQCTLYFTG